MHKETAFADGSMSVGMFGGVQFSTMFRGIIPDNSSDDSQLGTLLRDIWHYDNVGGSAVDLQCGLAFSNWTLIGIDQEIAELYADALARLDMRIMLPQISRNFLVDGAFIGTLLYDNKTNGFQDVLIHDRFNATISPQPLFSVDPVVVVNSASNLKQFLSSYSPYADATLRGYPKKILENFMNGSNVLDPVTTLLALRKGTTDSACVSYLRRLLPMYMLEKTLFRGTLTEASKRQRATTQIMMGTDDWEPTQAEMLEYTQKFQMSDMDPLGAWVATRQGVTLSDIRPAGEIWKWTDSADVLVPYKLRALGISEAFLSSDACMVGETLIPTDKGLVTIESLGTGKERNVLQSIDVNVVSRYGMGKAVGWIYNGFRDTQVIRTKTGKQIQCTGNHPVLVYDYSTNSSYWVHADGLCIGDILCQPPDNYKIGEAFSEIDYVLTEVIGISDGGKQHVYDISMKEGTEPAFVANGLIVHNTYANAEASLTMFMDNLDSYREFMTHKLFYSKLFPLIAITNNLYKDANEVKDRGTLDSLLYNMRNTKNLKMPTIQWTKNLKTPNSAALMENLDKLSEKGFPVGLKTWAAAANIDLSASLFDLEQDKKIRDQIAQIMGTDPSKIPGAPGASQAAEDGSDSEGGGDTEEASMSLDAFRRRIDSYPMKSALRTPTPSLLDREFGGDFKYNKAGKPVPASYSESKMANDRIVKAVRSLSDPHRFAEVKKQLIAKHGQVPKVGW